MICDNLSVTDGSLHFAGLKVSDIAGRYGTPLYVMDADRIRERCREYRNALGADGRVIYAGKAASFKYIYKIMAEEDMYIDVVSCGEIATAFSAGFPLERAYFHSCGKTDRDIAYALDKGIGYFVVDNEEELYAIDRICSERGIVQDILLRLTPGIDPHTFAAVSTGNVDSKFGFGITTGMAEDILKKTISCKNIRLCGFHCHMGSQIFDAQVFLDASDIMVDFVTLASEKYGIVTEQLDIGGGIGVRYTENDPVVDVGSIVAGIKDHITEAFRKTGLDMPVLCLEPGRSIVADAGLTVYSVASVKTIPGYKTYVCIDGGMTDNIRYALYGSKYTVVAADKADQDALMKCDLVGRCCESGDVIQPDILLPANTARGDLVAVLTTGAYNYSMASNYNRIPRPAVVMISEGKTEIAVKAETYDDMFRFDL